MRGDHGEIIDAGGVPEGATLSAQVEPYGTASQVIVTTRSGGITTREHLILASSMFMIWCRYVEDPDAAKRQWIDDPSSPAAYVREGCR